MSVIFDTKDSVFFVGGRGAKTGDQYAGGGCTKDFWGDLKNPSKSLSDVMGTNGEQLSDVAASLGDAACDVENNGSGKVRIIKSGLGYFTNCSAGLIANVNFAGVYTNGRYEVINVDSGSGNWVDIDESYSSDTTCGTWVGGAFNKLQQALDNTDANAGSAHNVYILTNKDETFSAAGDQIDVDAGGGSKTSNTWKRIIGINNNGLELPANSYTTINGNDQACHVFQIGDLDNIEFRHIAASNTSATSSYAGFWFSPTSTQNGFVICDCKSIDCYHAIYASVMNTRGVFVIGGYYKSDVATVIHFSACYAVLLENVHIVCGGAFTCMELEPLGIASVRGCIIEGNGSGTTGLYCDRMVSWLVISNSVFYNLGDCVDLNSSSGIGLVEHSNIFVVAMAASGKAINRQNGDIAYSDYSCLWGLDGTPSASGRWGGGGKPEHAIEQTPDFIDAANDNFRPRNPDVLRGGEPDIDDNATQMGAVLQKYQYATRAKTANLGRLQIIR
jgi:hypothetical protein